MRIRKDSPSGDMTFGNSGADFWVNVPDGVAQAIGSTLNLWAGQWFLDSRAGVPWDAQVLGNRTANGRDFVIRAAILGVPGVITLLSYSSRLDHATRAFFVSGSVQTQFGPAAFQFRQYRPDDAGSLTDDTGGSITDDGGAPLTP